MFCNFHWQMAETFFYRALGPETEGHIKWLNERKTKFALTCRFQKEFRVLAFRSREIFDNSIYFKILGTDLGPAL